MLLKFKLTLVFCFISPNKLYCKKDRMMLLLISILQYYIIWYRRIEIKRSNKTITWWSHISIVELVKSWGGYNWIELNSLIIDIHIMTANIVYYTYNGLLIYIIQNDLLYKLKLLVIILSYLYTNSMCSDLVISKYLIESNHNLAIPKCLLN